MKQDFSHVSRKFFFTGASGTGKSTAAIDLIKRYPADFIFIFDHDGEYAHRLNSFACRTGAEIESCIKSKRAVVFDPSHLYPGRTAEAFEAFCRTVWDARGIPGSKLFFFDEPALYLPTNSARYESHPLRAILETGRRFGIDSAFASQRAMDLHNAARQQATDVFCFRQGDPSAADWLKRQGFDVERAMTLPDGHYLFRNSKTGEKRDGKIQLPTK